MLRISALTIAFVIALLLTSCASPLDSSAPRIETPLTPAPKVTPSSYETEFSFGELQYVMIGSPTFLLDTTTKPVRFWMDFSMAQTAPNTNALIQEFRVNVDSLSADGYTYNLKTGQATLTMDLGQGPELFDVATDPGAPNTATALILELESPPGTPRMFQVTVFVEGNKGDFVPGFGAQQVLGRFVVTL